MQEPLKILVIRFSSIGDIILTTPIIRCLKQQLNADVDFLTKTQYHELLTGNPYINKIITTKNSTNFILENLRANSYDVIIDLQNNFRSFKLRLALGVKSYTFSKQNFKRYLLIYFGVDLLKNHVVDRYFKAVADLNVYNDEKGIDYFIKDAPKIDFNINQNYICWCIGGAHSKKKLSALQISHVINNIDLPILLLGGNEDKPLSAEVIKHTKTNNIYDFCGKTTIEESAYLIKESQLVLSNDTGMMHIASAFNVPIISFWGCTRPELGFAPYLPNASSVQLITNKSDRPCSKHGKHCKIQAKGCIKEIDEGIIFKNIKSLLK